MALTTYAELQASIADWLVRNDLTAVISDFITLAESRFNRELRVREMIATDTGTIADTIALPDDFIQVDVFRLDTSPIRVLQPISAAEGHRSYGTVGGDSRHFAIEGANLVPFPPQTGTVDYILSYFATLPALSTSNTSNWLLAKAPDLYLFGSLVEAAPYLDEDARLQLWEGKYQAAKSSLHAADRRAKFHQGPLAARVA